VEAVENSRGRHRALPEFSAVRSDGESAAMASEKTPSGLGRPAAGISGGASCVSRIIGITARLRGAEIVRQSRKADGGRNFHMATREKSAARAGARLAAPILILVTWVMFARPACAQGTGGYMRCVSASGRVMAGTSTDAAFNGWIPLRQTTIPTAAEISAMASEDAGTAAKEVHPPFVVVKDRDSSSLAILGAFTSKQHFPEIDIAVTNHSDHPAVRYKLTDAMIIAVRASVTPDGAQEPVEQLRIAYAKIEVQ
jgi:type VI protein secretion system component Hcp